MRTRKLSRTIDGKRVWIVKNLDQQETTSNIRAKHQKEYLSLWRIQNPTKQQTQRLNEIDLEIKQSLDAETIEIKPRKKDEHERI